MKKEQKCNHDFKYSHIEYPQLYYKELLDREVFDKSEEEYFKDKKWQEAKSDIIAFSICCSGFFLFLLLVIFLN